MKMNKMDQSTIDVLEAARSLQEEFQVFVSWDEPVVLPMYGECTQLLKLQAEELLKYLKLDFKRSLGFKILKNMFLMVYDASDLGELERCEALASWEDVYNQQAAEALLKYRCYGMEKWELLDLMEEGGMLFTDKLEDWTDMLINLNNELFGGRSSFPYTSLTDAMDDAYTYEMCRILAYDPFGMVEPYGVVEGDTFGSDEQLLEALEEDPSLEDCVFARWPFKVNLPFLGERSVILEGEAVEILECMGADFTGSETYRLMQDEIAPLVDGGMDALEQTEEYLDWADAYNMAAATLLLLNDGSELSDEGLELALTDMGFWWSFDTQYSGFSRHFMEMRDLLGLWAIPDFPYEEVWVRMRESHNAEMKEFFTKNIVTVLP